MTVPSAPIIDRKRFNDEQANSKITNNILRSDRLVHAAASIRDFIVHKKRNEPMCR